MRPIILFVVVGWSVLAVGGWPGVRAHAAEGSKDLPAPTAVGAQAGITRVAIAISGGPVAYTDQSSQDPPAIVIEFRSRNVIAALEPAVVVNSGIIKEIQSDYYPPDRRGDWWPYHPWHGGKRDAHPASQGNGGGVAAGGSADDPSTKA
ncbi:MAG: hypothetical protein HYZ89_01585 [Candidatus Omnitrophica bacterium]|nr:hypothetical protein [Candidatus Omnitrophota bacterium]